MELPYAPSRRAVLGLLGAAPLAALSIPTAAHAATVHPADLGLEAAIRAVTGRPEFRGSRWGMAFYRPGTGEQLYALSPGELFTAGSSFKVFIAGTAFEALGAGHRFRTRVYRTGPVEDGVLRGDLVLVAGGDLLIGGRLRADGTVAVPEPDHTYDEVPGAAPVPGDPLAVLRHLARRVAGRGVRRVDGRVIVDASLFREATGDVANGGMTVTLSPMMLNDNVVDVTVKAGDAAGAPAVLEVSPRVGYVTIANEVRTVAASARPRALAFVGDTLHPDGTRTVTLTGEVTVDGPGLFRVYRVPEPVRFAEFAFAAALRDEGVEATVDATAAGGAPGTRRRLAEHVSPALADELKVMLKVSSNPHTAMWPHVIGAVAGKEAEEPVAAYDEFRRRLYRDAGLEPDPAGAVDGLYTPDFFVRFLTHVSRRPYFARFCSALPVMGRDGSLTDVQVGSPAAGRVFAKTGTAGYMVPGGGAMVHKSLAGYIRPPSGGPVVFAQFVGTEVASAEDIRPASDRAGEALGEIASAVYEHVASDRKATA